MKTYISSYYSTKIGELWHQSLFDLVEEVFKNIIKQARISIDTIDAIFFANMLGGIVENNLHANAKLAELMGISIPIFRVESACASGGIAIHLAKSYLEANRGKTVLVIGAEKMTDTVPEEIVEGLVSAASGEEQNSGLTFAGLYAIMARAYMKSFKYSMESCAAVAVKNHLHALDNPYAHFHKKITMEDVLISALVADPLRVLDCSPVSDGAAGFLMTSDEKNANKNKRVELLACEVATDSISLSKRKSILELYATQQAADKAFTVARLKRSHISIAEIHDCFTIAELLAMEDLGFWKKGEAGKRIMTGETQNNKNNRLIINPSGGLKASGHPVGTTGIKQMGEIYLQLTKQAGNRQVAEIKFGLTHNVGGSGGTAVVSILGV